MTDNRTTELLPCPFCGGEAELHTRRGANGMKQYRYRCSECHASIGRWHGGVSGPPWTALETWNTRAATTIGKLQVEIEPVVRGTLTAEQVEKAIHDCSTYASYDGCTYYASGIRLQAIADELNARAERTCECIAEYAESPFDGKTIVLHRCSECHELMRPHMLYCPNCGARVVGGDAE